MSNSENLGTFLGDKLKQHDPSDKTFDGAQRKSHMEAVSMLMNPDLTQEALDAHGAGKLNHAVARYLGSCPLDLFDPEEDASSGMPEATGSMRESPQCMADSSQYQPAPSLPSDSLPGGLALHVLDENTGRQGSLS